MDTLPAAARAAVQIARRAPSVHNTQPWRWTAFDGGLRLHADRSRQLPMIDEDGRDLLLSCGAALHHARIAGLALGCAVEVTRRPDPADPDHLADLVFGGPAPATAAQALVAATAVRRTDRRPFQPEPVPGRLLDAVAAAVRAERVDCTVLRDGRRGEVIGALAHADTVRRRNPNYADELLDWARRHLAPVPQPTPESVPESLSESLAEAPLGPLPAVFAPDLPGDRIGGGELSGPPPPDDAAVLAVLSTREDGPVDWLRTGEALSAGLLTATVGGLASCVLSQVNEVKVVRDLVREVALGGHGHPHLVLRLGWPTRIEFPAEPRRPRRRAEDAVSD
jgi:nitroreductase